MKNIDPCPVTANRLRQLRAVAVVAVDDKGATRFDGDNPQKIAAAAMGFVPAGPVQWSYETRNGSIVVWPAFAKAQADPGNDQVWVQVERMADLIARVHRDAYRQANEMLAETLNAQGSVMATLANRTIYLEERLTTVEQTQSTQGVDDLATKVLDHALNHAAAAAKPKAKPNGTT